MVAGIIYAILDDGYFFIGSTTQSILERITLHINASKSYSKKYKKLYKYINEIRKGWEDIIYITLEEVECNSEYELKKKEYSYIESFINDKKCLNNVQNIKQEYMIYYRKKFK
jgi:Uri superfamily endonuclease